MIAKSTDNSKSGIAAYYLASMDASKSEHTTENFMQVVSSAMTVTAIWVDLETAPGTGGDAYTFTFRIDAGNTALTVTLTDDTKTANLTGQSVAVLAGEEINTKITPGAAPSVTTGGVQIGYAASIP